MENSEKKFIITRFENGRETKSGIDFDYIDPDFPVIAKLREQEGLLKIAEESRGEFELIRGAMQYVKNVWDHSWHYPMQMTNALEIIEDVRSGLRGNFCVYFSHVLGQALWSLGIPWRYTHVAEHHWHSHSSSECWSNEHGKWIVVDADFNAYFARPLALESYFEKNPVIKEFVPQNALEMQRAWRSGKMDEIIPVQGNWSAGMDYKMKLGDLFGGVFGFIADYKNVLENGPPEWEGSRCRWYVWDEPGHPFSDYYRHNFELTHGNGECRYVSDEKEYYWTLNEVVINVDEQRRYNPGDYVELSFETFTPFFSCFQVKINDNCWTDLQPKQTSGHKAWGKFVLKLDRPRNVFRIRTKNKSGRMGAESLMEIAQPEFRIPESAGVIPGVRAPGLGSMSVKNGTVYIPAKPDGKILIVDTNNSVGVLGKPIEFPHVCDKPPAEPWSENVNIRRAMNVPPGELLSPVASDSDMEGNVFVADAENYRICVFPKHGSLPYAWGTHGDGDCQFLHLRDLKTDDSSVVIADSGYSGPVGPRTKHKSRVRRFGRDGSLTAVIAEEGTKPGEVISPAGLFIDSEKNVWVADSGNHRIQCLSFDGKPLLCWGEKGDGWGELLYPACVVVSSENVFVADPQHRCVWKFTRDGQALARIDRTKNNSMLIRPGRLALRGGRLLVGDVSTGYVHEYIINEK